MLSYYEEVQTLQYALLKYFLSCQIIQNISDPAQWLHRVWGWGGWWQLLTQQADEQPNFEWHRQKLLAGKEKENSQIFNADFYLPLYLPLWPTRSVSFILLYAHKIIEKEFKETIFQKSFRISGWTFRSKKTKNFAFGPVLTGMEKQRQKISSKWTFKCNPPVKRINPNE